MTTTSIAWSFCINAIRENEDGLPADQVQIQMDCALALKELTEDERSSAILFYHESVERFGRDLRSLTIKE